ncbi:hypothetical protein XFF6990_340008 [Xanthomonas citri pv. fuscans]|uniref:Uncharacterized protein n=1 Tax=Xanthomonas campestris pv. phaseoli TaxID=317013 RepID=A0A7Z7NFJ0_XANCH|nr:hypothetical protein XFF6990_340008 [Xanthomonas citri pv. fuscans]SOO22738.1 hypothetical protein XFF6991_150502 [Xanthomonas phaseoli pv. phaseoli]
MQRVRSAGRTQTGTAYPAAIPPLPPVLGERGKTKPAPMQGIRPRPKVELSLILAAQARHRRHLHLRLTLGFDQPVLLDHPAREQATLQPG